MFIYFNVVMYFDIKARSLDDSGKYAGFNEQITINTKDIGKCYETGSINFHQNVRNIRCLTYYICDIIDYIVKKIIYLVGGINICLVVYQQYFYFHSLDLLE